MHLGRIPRRGNWAAGLWLRAGGGEERFAPAGQAPLPIQGGRERPGAHRIVRTRRALRGSGCGSVKSVAREQFAVGVDGDSPGSAVP